MNILHVKSIELCRFKLALPSQLFLSYFMRRELETPTYILAYPLLKLIYYNWRFEIDPLQFDLR